MSWLRPSFSSHPGNYLLAFMVGLLFFFIVSIAKADGSDYYPGVVWGTAGVTFANTALASCQANKGPNAYLSPNGTQNGYTKYYCIVSGQTAVTTRAYLGYCDPGGLYEGQPACDPPLPPEPQDCTELASQEDPSGTIYISDKFWSLGCDQGCYIEMDTAMYSQTESNWLINGSFTGADCPAGGGYDSSKPMVMDIKDVVPEDQDWQNCYRPDGTFLGRIGVDMTCPTFVNCWNEDRTHIDAVAPDPGSCPTGTTSDSSRDWADATKESTSSTTTNPDGSTDTTTETKTTQTAPDGSKSYTTTTRATSCDSLGNCTTTETTKEEGSTCTGDDCETTMTAENVNDCDKPLECKGDVHQCALLQIAREQACNHYLENNLSESSVENWFNDNPGDFVSVDGDGQLNEVGISTSLDLDSIIDPDLVLQDNGRSGSCPAPTTLSLLGSNIQFEWTAICDVLTQIRPLVIFSASFICLLMVGNAVTGTRFRG